jgi:hypothetical protein
MTDPRESKDGAADAADVDTNITDLATRFASSRPPAHGPSRTLAEWVQMFAACPHPANGVVRATLMDAGDTRAPFEWCGTCGAVRFPIEANGGWWAPGLALVLGADGVAGFDRAVGALAKQLAELLESARAIKSAVATGPSASADLLEKVRLFEVDCFQVEQGAKACLGEWAANVRLTLP